jgi:mRNA interferase MazF
MEGLSVKNLPAGCDTFVAVPYTDRTGIKRRPVLVLSKVNDVEYFVLEITSQPLPFLNGVILDHKSDLWGGLKRVSQVRYDRILTAHYSLLRLHEAAVNTEILNSVIRRVLSLLPKN